MALKLRIISEQYQQLGKHSTREFGSAGGRIGRSADNDWILPDPDRYISSHHAQIKCEGDRWIIEDTSTNGVFVNGKDIPLSEEGPCELHDGDHIRMGDYDILVSLDEHAAAPVAAPPTKAARKPATPARDEHEDLNEEIDINALLSGEIAQFANSDNTGSGPFEIGNVYGVHVKDELPRSNNTSAQLPALTVPDVYEDIPLSEGQPRKATLQVVASNGAAVTTGGEDWHLRTRRLQKDDRKKDGRASDAHSELNAGIEAFCRGLGIDPASLPSEMQAATLSLAGQMLREAVLGLMEALKNRGEFKGKFDPTQTTVQPTENNPLKISVGVDDAVRKLMDAHNSRYMGPVEALREAFGDLRTHQLALNSAMHAGLNGLMQRLQPNELQDRFDRGLKRGGLLGASNKAKYWEMYAEFFPALNQRNSDGMPVSFGEDFVQAYLDKSKAGKKK